MSRSAARSASLDTCDKHRQRTLARDLALADIH